jgi:hypothetical protein
MPNGRCKLDGGKSTGPRTPEGLEGNRRANWKHGYYSREAKAERSRLRAAILAPQPVRLDLRGLINAITNSPNRPLLLCQYKRISTQDYRDSCKDNSCCKLRDLFYLWCGLL